MIEKGLILSYSFSTANLGEFLCSDDLRKVVLPKDIGYFSREETKINDDIFLYKYNHDIHKDMSIGSKTTNSFFDIHIVLNDDSYYKSKLTNSEQYTKSGYTTSSFISEENGVSFKKANSKLKSIEITIKDNFLQNHLFNQLQNIKDIYSKPTTLFKNRPTNLKTKICANELFNSPHTGILDKLYMESKVLEILYHEFGDILSSDKNLKSHDKIRFDDYDIEALHLARDILINNIQNPPSMQELSKLVKLNEFKLKVGFKQKFNITPYKLVTQYRMQKAKQLLETGDMNIYEISKLVGYKYQNNFTKVFKEHFGIRPSELIKSRKYYY